MTRHRPNGTKIVATIGPATVGVEPLAELIRAGVDVVRLNFSHGTRPEHEKAVRNVRSAAEQLEAPIALMGDLCGPKIRLLEIEGGQVHITEGSQIRIQYEAVLGNGDRLATNQPDMLQDVKVGDRVLVDDGAVRFRVVDRDAGGLICECEVGGPISNRKGLNVPDSDLRGTALTDKDREDAEWAVEQGMEFLALSFVRNADDVHELRDLLRQSDGGARIIAKIETRHAIDNLQAIVDASDGVIVARGDLGVEMDVAVVPRLQKDITDRCRRAAKPVIIATQMLQSMVHSPSPTRAEVNDVANAIFDGADAVLLSAETAVGEYPIEAIQVLERVAAETEQYDQLRLPPIEVERAGGFVDVTAAVARSLCKVADDVEACAVVLWTETGELARLVSKHRLDRPVLALAASPEIQRRLALYFGVQPILTTKPRDANERVAQADSVLLEGGFAKPGDRVVVGFGPRSHGFGETGSIVIHQLPDR